MATAPSRTLVGSVLSRRWRLVQKLGGGGIGEVYVAEPVSGAARVAVKVLRSDFLADAPVLARFAEEGHAAVRLIHPNIVRVLECATAEDGLPYVVMELLEGVRLGAYTQKGGRVPTGQAVAIIQGILSGLTAARAQGVIHRDLKPDNVFLMRHPSGSFVVKVLDFGTAKVMDAAGGMGSRARTGMLLGTPAYMSPEQATGASDADERADVWSAGVMLYEMLTGHVAFPAPTEYARLSAVLTIEPEPMDRLDRALAPLAPIVTRALKKNRSERFASALEMARALAMATSNEVARSEAAGELPAPAGAQPLSRLPDVPSLFKPSAAASSQEASPLAQTAPAPLDHARGGRQKPGGTLASAADPHAVAEPMIQANVAGIGETLPSKKLPAIFDRAVRTARGVAPAVVVALVAISLAVGFLLGWAVARMTPR